MVSWVSSRENHMVMICQWVRTGLDGDEMGGRWVQLAWCHPSQSDHNFIRSLLGWLHGLMEMGPLRSARMDSAYALLALMLWCHACRTIWLYEKWAINDFFNTRDTRMLYLLAIWRPLQWNISRLGSLSPIDHKKKRFIKMWNLTRLAYISMIKLHLVINIEQTSKIACLSHSLFCLSCILFFFLYQRSWYW